MFSFSTMGINVGLLIMRVGIGCIFIIHGIPKILGGFGTWKWLGSQMAHVGITFLPIMWGFLAAVTTLFGGMLLALGLRVRPVCVLLAFTMFIAFTMHFKQGDSFQTYSHALSLLIIFIGLFFTGGGRYALDTRL